jgi:hypothetical protein
MNTVCPYCGEPQHYSVIWADTVVPCGHCGREFLLCNKPRDLVESTRISPVVARGALTSLFQVVTFPFRLLSGNIYFPF